MQGSFRAQCLDVSATVARGCCSDRVFEGGSEGGRPVARMYVNNAATRILCTYTETDKTYTKQRYVRRYEE